MKSTNWDADAIHLLYQKPLIRLLGQAYQVHCEHHDPDEMELCTLLSIKTGTCPEDCAYCPQSGHYNTGLQKEKLWDVADVVEKAKQAKERGAKRFCMGGAWRSPPKKYMPALKEMVVQVKALGLETCLTAGMLDQEQADDLKKAGLDYYNHNLDTSPEHYKKIISTRNYQERIDTLKAVDKADINICCGGIVGMGETREDRVQFFLQLLALPAILKSVPINRLIRIPGTPLELAEPMENFEFIKTIAIARILFPTSMVRLSAGREDMSDEMQTLCFMAGSNSIFYGDELLTAKNQSADEDETLLEKLGMHKGGSPSTASVVGDAG